MSVAAGGAPFGDTVLEKFQPHREIVPKKVYAFFGSRGSGKTRVMEDVGYFLRHLGEVVVFSATEDGNQTWSSHVPSTFIHKGFDGDALKKIMARQRQRIEEYNQDPKNIPYPHLLIIFEDMMAENKSFVRNPDVRWIFLNGRHIGITMMLTVQYLMDLERGLRDNIDFVFCMKIHSRGNAERIWDQWAGMVCPDLAKFKDIITKTTENYGCLVIRCGANALNGGTKLSDTLSWYRSVQRGNYHIGSKGIWAFHFRYGAGARTITPAASVRPATQGRTAPATRSRSRARSRSLLSRK